LGGAAAYWRALNVQKRSLVICSEFALPACLGWPVYGGQLELRFGSSRSEAFFRKQSTVEAAHRHSASITSRQMLAEPEHLYCVDTT
jgi:hypothetical protein